MIPRPYRPKTRPLPSPPAPDRSDDAPVPVFGTWRNAYGTVVVCALAVMALLYLFQGWSF